MSEATLPVIERRDDQLETVAWGLVAVLAGVVILPDGPVATVLAGLVGGGLVAVNLVRVAWHLDVSLVSSVLGVAVLASAVAAAAGVALPAVAAFFVLFGVAVIGTALLRRG
jgi:hypothetical protein